MGPFLAQPFFAPSTEVSVLERAILDAQLFDFESLGPSVHRLPVADLLPDFGVLSSEPANYLAGLEDFTPNFPHQVGERERIGMHAFCEWRLCFNQEYVCRPLVNAGICWAKVCGRLHQCTPASEVIASRRLIPSQTAHENVGAGGNEAKSRGRLGSPGRSPPVRATSTVET